MGKGPVDDKVDPEVGIVTGNPGVSQGYPYPYPLQPAPTHTHAQGYGFWRVRVGVFMKPRGTPQPMWVHP